MDDEAMLLHALARALRAQYEVTTLSSPAEALRRLASGVSWDVILADVVMPEMNGVEFASRVVEVRPEFAGRIALMTGSACTPKASGAVNQLQYQVIAKPFDFAVLLALLAKLSSGQT